MKLQFFIMIILVMPLALAIECDKIEQKELCEEIKNSDLTEEEKEYLLSDIIDDLKNFPSHEYIRKWNLNINTSEPPDNTKTYDRGYIKDAWVKILTVMPSVLENNTLYCGSEGEVLSAYDHDVEIPTEKMRDDCRTKYRLRQDKVDLNVSINNKHIGSGMLVSFETDIDPKIRADYSIEVKTDIDHYKYKKTCCEWKGRKCKKWCKKCEYDNTEEKIDNLKITDTFTATYYNETPTVDFFVKDKYKETTKAIFSGSNFTSLHLDFPQSYLKEFHYYYSTIWHAPPYHVLIVKAEKKKRTEHYNLLYEGTNPYTLFVKNIKACGITVYTHFTQETIPCTWDVEELDITINTDQLVYEQNETILVTVQPTDRAFNLTYANNTTTMQGSTILRAQYPYNKISIMHNDREYTKIIHVKNDKPFSILFSLIIFLGINKAFIELMRKYWWW